MWAKKGRQPKVITFTSKRERKSIIAATNLRTGAQTSLFFDTGDSRTFIEFLKVVLQEYPQENICMILDNVRFHHSKLVQEFLEKNSRLEFMFLPLYSPDLNPQEWIFKWFRKEVTHNHNFTSFNSLLNASYDFFTPLQKPNLLSLITVNF